MECGDLSPLPRFADSSAKQAAFSDPKKMRRASSFDGDKSPAKSGDKSPYSKVIACR